ncbi:MAG: S8 family serine peptidase [Anaerolineales bacterium]|nr:S8 family serine peptidase [Anaerolineales bacterium]
MKRLFLTLCLLLALCGLDQQTQPAPAQAQTFEGAYLVGAEPGWVPGPGWTDVTPPALAALGLHRLIAADAPALEQSLASDPGVRFSAPERSIAALDQTITPNDADWVLQYGPAQIQVPEAWQLAAGCAVSTLAIVDSGVDLDHPDLVGRIWFNAGEVGGGRETNGLDDDGNGYADDWRGWDFSNRDNDPDDDYGHGTHVAGIANASANNRIGIAGVAGAAWGVRIMALKVLNAIGMGLDGNAAEAIKYAVDNGAQVINLSLGDPLPTPALEQALSYAAEHGVLVVAASGNSGISGVYYPARYETALAVGAVTSDNQRAYFSSYGPELDLVAPGVAIYATVPGGGYAYRSGTSMATPHISGVAALLARMPQYGSARLMRDALIHTARVLTPVDNTDFFGFGLVQARDALDWNPEGAPGACYAAFLPSIESR